KLIHLPLLVILLLSFPLSSCSLSLFLPHARRPFPRPPSLSACGIRQDPKRMRPDDFGARLDRQRLRGYSAVWLFGVRRARLQLSGTARFGKRVPALRVSFPQRVGAETKSLQFIWADFSGVSLAQ
ncbi:unnamed protein product, partial [Citrullus colocynthis]